jgi:hypothetical protein
MERTKVGRVFWMNDDDAHWVNKTLYFDLNFSELNLSDGGNIKATLDQIAK